MRDDDAYTATTADRLFDPLHWKNDAACLHADPDLFFPGRGQDVNRAKAVCATCLVVGPCLDYALANRIHHGVWGGMSEKQRRAMRSPNRTIDPVPAPCGTNRGYMRHYRQPGPVTCAACLRAHSVAQADTRARRATLRLVVNDDVTGEVA